MGVFMTLNNDLSQILATHLNLGSKDEIRMAEVRKDGQNYKIIMIPVNSAAQAQEIWQLMTSGRLAVYSQAERRVFMAQPLIQEIKNNPTVEKIGDVFKKSGLVSNQNDEVEIAAIDDQQLNQLKIAIFNLSASKETAISDSQAASSAKEKSPAVKPKNYAAAPVKKTHKESGTKTEQHHFLKSQVEVQIAASVANKARRKSENAKREEEAQVAKEWLKYDLLKSEVKTEEITKEVTSR